MKQLSFTVPAIPVAQPRQRSRTIRTKTGREFAHNYTPARHPVNAFKASVQLAAHQKVARASNGVPYDGPIELIATFVMPRPRVKVWKRKPMRREPHIARPDIDNLLKALADALSGILWRDDAQVYAVDAGKVIAAGDETPHVEVTVRRLEEGETP